MNNIIKFKMKMKKIIERLRNTDINEVSYNLTEPF